jgi:hypothetical protein
MDALGPDGRNVVLPKHRVHAEVTASRIDRLTPLPGNRAAKIVEVFQPGIPLLLEQDVH